MSVGAAPMDADGPVAPRRRRGRGIWLAGVAVLAIGASTALFWQVATPTSAGARSGGAVAERSDLQETIRIAGFNMHSGKGEDGVQDLGRIAEELAGLDVAVLNEVRYSADQAAALAKWRDMTLLPAPSERRWWRDDFGNAILTSVPVTNWAVFPLEHSRGRGWRNLTIASVQLEGVTLTLLATHLDNGPDRAGQLEVVLGLLESIEPPVLLVGDLNTRGEDPRLAQTLRRQDVQDVLGNLAGVAPEAHIDWLLFRPGGGVRAVAAGLRETPASDHPLVWVELSLGSEAGRSAP